MMSELPQMVLFLLVLAIAVGAGVAILTRPRA